MSNNNKSILVLVFRGVRLCSDEVSIIVGGGGFCKAVGSIITIIIYGEQNSNAEASQLSNLLGQCYRIGSFVIRIVVKT